MKHTKTTFFTAPIIAAAGVLFVSSLGLLYATKRTSVPRDLCGLSATKKETELGKKVHLDKKEDFPPTGLGKILWLEKRRLDRAAKNTKEEDVDSKQLFHEKQAL